MDSPKCPERCETLGVGCVGSRVASREGTSMSVVYSSCLALLYTRQDVVQLLAVLHLLELAVDDIERLASFHRVLERRERKRDAVVRQATLEEGPRSACLTSQDEEGQRRT